jgi:uncharacterized protein (TIGR02266 family)
MVSGKDLGQSPKVGLTHKDNKETSALLHIERLETALFNISSAITAHQDLNKTLEVIVQESLNCLKANRSTIFLIDPKSGNLKPQFTQALDALDERVGLFEEREVAQKTFELKKPFLVGGRGKSSDLPKGQKHERKIISLMSFPLSSKGDTMGVASLVLINEEDGFDEKNMQFFSSFVNLASIAMEMSNLPEGAHKRKGFRMPSEPGTEDTPDQLPTPSEKESRRAHIPLLKIKAEPKVEGKRGLEVLSKEKIFRAPSERGAEDTLGQLPSPHEKESRRDDIPLVKIKAEPKVEEKRGLEFLNKGKISRDPNEPGTEDTLGRLPSPHEKESRRDDIPLVKIKAEPKVEEKRGLEVLNKGKISRDPNEPGMENIPAQPQSPPEKKIQGTDQPIVKKKAEQRVEEPRIIEGPNKERIAWAPGTVSLKEDAGIERRTEERVETTVRAEFQEEYWGITKNLSNGGAFIVTSTPLELGDEIVLKLHLPDGGEELEVDCKVVWTNQYGRETQDMRRGMGVKFLNLQPESQKRIHSYIEFQKNRNLRLER